jgi:hypothetical protein
VNCANCGLPKTAHTKAVGESGQRIWKCPNGSGSLFPINGRVKVELHYQAGEEFPWIAKWTSTDIAPGEVVSGSATDVLEAAARGIDMAFEAELEIDKREASAIEQVAKERF